MKTLLALFILSVGSLNAASFYVDYVGGSDSAAGTSTSVPWKHCPGDPAATSTAAAATISAGDTINFKGGVTYVLAGSTGIILGHNGTAGNVVTYDGNSAGTWGTGKAKITDNNRSPGLFAMRATSADLRYVTIKNILFKDCGGSASLPTDLGSAVAPNSGAGIYANGRMTGVTIDSCDFTQLGYWFNQKPMSAASIVGAGIEFDGGCTGTLITNCTFSRTMIGIECQWTTPGGIDGLTISFCTFTDSLVWGIDPNPTSPSTMTNVSIHDNLFFDYYQFDDPAWTGYGEWPHTDGIFLRCDPGGYTSTWGVINIYNNTFSSTRTTAGGTASIYITEGPSANIYNNDFIHQGKTRAISLANGMHVGSSPQVVRILNNTFICAYVNQIDWGEGSGSNAVGYGVGSSILIQNNVFVDQDSSGSNNFMIYSVSTSPVTSFNFDYNQYLTGNQLGQFFKSNITGEAALAAVRTNAGWEVSGAYGNPLFVTSITAGTDPTTANLNLQSGSPARSSGANLTSLAVPLTGITFDKNGNARPASGAWDKGAHQNSTGGGSDVTAPTPNPSTIASTSVLGSTSYSVTATTATDAGSPPVLYRFSNDGGSSWTAYQSGATYTFTGLAASTGYPTKVQAKDSAGTPNVTTASASTTVTTDPAPAVDAGIPARRKGSGKKPSPSTLTGALP